jgi:hypothetical protein
MLSEAQVHNLRHASTTQNLVASGFAPTIPSPFKAAAIFATPADLFAFVTLGAPALT